MGNNNRKYGSVMLIDDNEIDNLINQKMMEGYNFAESVYIHTSGRSALEFLKNLDRSENIPDNVIPAVIFLDINMPIMDGFQFMREFETLSPRVREHAKVVILTTSINPTDKETSESNPYIKAYINKPLTKDTLDNL